MNYIGIFLGSLIIVWIVSYLIGFDRGFNSAVEVEESLRGLQKFTEEVSDEQR